MRREMNFMKNVLVNNKTGDAMQLNNVEILYTKVQRVYVKSQHKEERQKDLRVNVEIHSGISPVCQKSLCVLLADDDDPCFLYSLLITDEDFKILKAQQGLLVDFDNFAPQLISLLEQCNVSCPGSSKGPPKFLLLLTEENGTWIFKLVETNNFKHLCHLSLSIAPASDHDIKTHMAMKIKKLKEDLGNRNKEAVGLETRLSALNDDFERKVREYEQLEQRFSTEQNQLQMTTTHQLSIEKERLAQAKLEWQKLSELEKINIERRHSEILQQLHVELSDLRAQNLSYREKQNVLELTNADHLKQLQTLERDLEIAQRDLSHLKKQNSKLDVDYHDKDKVVNDLRMRVAVLEQDLKDKTILINKHVEMWKTGKEQKQQLEELLADKENQLQRKQNSLKHVGEEVIKANEVIKKIQNELSTAKSKLKLRTSICLEQEKLLDTKQKEIGQLETKVEESSKIIRDLKSDVESLRNEVRTLKSQIESQEKTIKNNDNVISWLNRRLADNQMPLQNVTTPVAINVPSNFQLTLPRTNKFITNKYDSKTPTTGTTLQQSAPLTGGFNLRNGIQTSNANQTSRTSPGRAGLGLITDNTVEPGGFTRTGHMGSTSTPMERMNIYHKLPSAGLVEIAGVNGGNENNNGPLGSNMVRSKSATGVGLRRAVLDKPLLPSAYFSKPLH
ncbi:spindle assembly abnormal protein 6 homolog [Diachasmimorpha longicaudata]|uniref:spindle assembly abnormal protein 6 homolog n=1 Tax=Diachasmimorpha longicaudata TaxID=58733 RepID=UPI0030B8D40A